MKNLLLLTIAICLGMAEMLDIDSITDPGNWLNPENILVSSDLYSQPSGNQDVLELSFIDPADTADRTLDSVKVYLEQHVSDSQRALWFVRPVINGTRRTATPQQNGSLTDSVLCFDVSSDITGWADLYDFRIELHPKVGTGQQPEWYADYLYVYAYQHSTVGIDGDIAHDRAVILSISTLVRDELHVSYNALIPGDILIEIFNNAGMRVLSKKVQGTTPTLKEVGQFPTGVYYLSVVSRDGSIEHGVLRKFIVIE
jgi:hypothetical protein